MKKIRTTIPNSYRKKRLNNGLFIGLTYLLLTLFAVGIVYPIYFTIITSLKTTTAYASDKVGLPAIPTLSNFSRVLVQMDMLTFLFNTLLVVGVSMVLYFLVCTAAGFAFGKLRFKGRLGVFTFILFYSDIPSDGHSRRDLPADQQDASAKYACGPDTCLGSLFLPIWNLYNDHLLQHRSKVLG